MNRNRLYILALAMLMLPMLTGCRQELCYDHFPTLDVRFNWEQEWERDYGVHHLDSWDPDYFGLHYDDIRPGNPEWINMIRYYADGSHSENFMTPAGEAYEVEAGRECSILLYNGDTEYLVISDVASLNEARATATARSRSGAAMQVLYEAHSGSRTTNPPDIIYSAFIQNVPGIANHETRAFNVKMQPLVYTYVIMYEFDYGIDNVVLARGAIGGMAEAVYLRTGVTSEQSAIILFDCDITPRGCLAKVNSFGAPGFPDIYYGRRAEDSPARVYTLNLELKLKNGQTLDYTYDISDQMRNQPRGGVIKITGLKIDDVPDQPQGGFQVEVTGWDDTGIIEDLPIGNQVK